MPLALVFNRNRRTALEESPAFAHVAERFRRAGDLQRAVALCRDGLRTFPEHVSARVTLGLALLDLGQHADARAELRHALSRAPDNLAAIRGMAALHDHGESDLPGQDDWQAPEVEIAEAAHAKEAHAENAGYAEVLAAESLWFDSASTVPMPESPAEPELTVEEPPEPVTPRFELEDLLAQADGLDELLVPFDDDAADEPVNFIEAVAPSLDAAAVSEKPQSVQPTLLALERFLMQVQTRKLITD